MKRKSHEMKIEDVMTINPDWCLPETSDSVQIRQAMTSQPVTCHPTDKLKQAADVMKDNRIRRVPNVDDEGILQGMVSTADIIQRSTLSSDVTQDILRKVTKPTEEASRPRARMERAA